MDRRADIWAFGCVLYEMLTGKKAFPADTVTETLAAVLKNEPDWSQLPSFRLIASFSSHFSLLSKGQFHTVIARGGHILDNLKSSCLGDLRSESVAQPACVVGENPRLVAGSRYCNVTKT